MRVSSEIPATLSALLLVYPSSVISELTFLQFIQVGLFALNLQFFE